MNSTTRRQLNSLNHRFYSERADEFDATRQHEWPGWQSTVELFNPPPSNTRSRVLDIGCGNGRFAHFLLKNHPIGEIEYTGVDQSPELLAMAEKGCIGSKGDSLRWLEFDATSPDLEEALLPDQYDLVVAFGLLHHIPSLEYRRRLISYLSSRTDTQGTLVFTIWRFNESKRFREKIIPWQDYNHDAVEKIDTAELEKGDHLLSFGDRGGTARYCHALDEGEIEALTESLGIERLAQFTADGKTNDLNEYHVFVKSKENAK